MNRCPTCGFAWPVGTFGGHSCAAQLAQRIDRALGHLREVDRISLGEEKAEVALRKAGRAAALAADVLDWRKHGP